MKIELKCLLFKNILPNLASIIISVLSVLLLMIMYVLILKKTVLALYFDKKRLLFKDFLLV